MKDVEKQSQTARTARSRWWFVLPGLLAGALMGVFIASTQWPASSSLDTPVNLPADVAIDPKLDEPIPLDLVFRNEQGHPVKVGDLIGGKPAVLNLVYYQCPMLCKLEIDGFIRTLKTLQFGAGSDFTVLTVSFDPREGPRLAAAAKRSVLKRYDRAGAEAGWHFLTGDVTSIRRLTDACGFRYAFDEKTGQYAHGAGLFVLTPEGRVSRFLSGVEFAARDLRLGIVEASQGRIGKTSDRVLLLCYQYDPTTGKYGLVIMNVIRLAGGLTVLLLATGLLAMIRKQRQAERHHALAGVSNLQLKL